MRLDRDGDDGVAGPGGARLALAGEADAGAVLDALGQLEVDGLAVGQRDPLRLQLGRIDERDGQPIGDVGALLRLPRRAGRSR